MAEIQSIKFSTAFLLLGHTFIFYGVTCLRFTLGTRVYFRSVFLLKISPFNQNWEFYIFKFPSQLFLRRGLVVCLFKSQVAEIEGKFERNSNFWWLLFWSRQTPLEISRPIFYWNCQQNICDGGIGKVLRSCRNGLQSGAGENRHKKRLKDALKQIIIGENIIIGPSLGPI